MCLCAAVVPGERGGNTSNFEEPIWSCGQSGANSHLGGIWVPFTVPLPPERIAHGWVVLMTPPTLVTRLIPTGVLFVVSAHPGTIIPGKCGEIGRDQLIRLTTEEHSNPQYPNEVWVGLSNHDKPLGVT